jgi:hypothetical protein
MDELTFSAVAVERAGERVVIVLFDGPALEVVIVARCSVETAHQLGRALGSALNSDSS